MKFVELKKSLKEKIYPCYIIEGDDVFLLYKSLELIKNFTVPNMPEFNEVDFTENASYTAQGLVESLLVLPIGSDLRLVVCKDCSLKATKENLKALNGYLLQPNEKACLVFFNSTKNEFTSKLTDAMIVDCNRLSAELVIKLIAQKCDEAGKKIGTLAASALAKYCLNNLGRIYSELDKLFAYAKDSEEISKEDIENNVLKELDFQIFEFAQAVAMKNAEKSFEILDKLLIKKENFGVVLSGLYNQFSRMFMVSTSNLTKDDMAKALSIKPFAVQKIYELASRFSKRKLKNIIELIGEAEFELKSGKKTSEAACERLVYEIIALV